MFAILRLVPGSEPEPLETLYTTGSDAAKAARELNATNSAHGVAIRFRVVPHKGETSEVAAIQWRAREHLRFTNGTYRALPWAMEPWFLASPLHNVHFAHVSTDDASQVAFTETEDKGIADKQLRMRPARYLTKFFPELGDVSARDWAAKFAAENETNNLVKFAVTADEIEDVYTNGPSSCMSHPASDYASPFHPVRVYAGPDLQVAYLTRDGDITARSVCWPEKKLYTRVYGDETRFENLMSELGYEQRDDALQGARIARHEYDGGFVAPYLDYISGVDDNGDYLVITDNCDIACQSTNGLTEDAGWRCEYCGDVEDEDCSTWIADREERWCERCTDRNCSSCDDCGETHYRDDGFTHVSNGNHVCEDCLGSYSHCDHCEEYHEESRVEQDCEENSVCRDCARDMETAPCGKPQPDGVTCECDECEDHREELAAEEAAEADAEADALGSDDATLSEPTAPVRPPYRVPHDVLEREGQLRISFPW